MFIQPCDMEVWKWGFAKDGVGFGRQEHIEGARGGLKMGYISPGHS